MNGFHWKDFDAEKRKQFINYLKHRNKKVGAHNFQKVIQFPKWKNFVGVVLVSTSYFNQGNFLFEIVFPMALYYVFFKICYEYFFFIHQGHVFLDIFEEAEYDPMLLNKKRPGPIKVILFTFT